MSTYLSPAELRGHVPGIPLDDAALEDVIVDIEAEIIDRYGEVGARTERIGVGYLERGPLTLARRPLSVTSVTELLNSAGSEVRVLAANDYRLVGRILYRESGGPTPAWGWSFYGTDVVYVPRDDTVRRKMAVVDVAKLELAHKGYTSIRIGDYAETVGSGSGQGGRDDLEARRSRIIGRLASGFVLR